MGKPWAPGQSGNPAGRKPGSRNKLEERLLADLAEAWQTHGRGAIARVVKESPLEFIKICAGLLPKQLHAEVDNTLYVIADKPLTAQQWEDAVKDMDFSGTVN